ncbi:LysE family translocator [Palleronia pontilimi]|uniref:LysE family translocator n=1 Tax=Palleronia pontilimi TaxID=1964209 RepID=UPI0034CF65B1
MAETIAALIVFLFPLAYSPGPGNLFFAASGARFGFRATVPANLGYHLATFGLTLALGHSALAAMDRFDRAFELMRWAGAIYVLWLAIGLMRAGSGAEAQVARPAGAIDGALLLVLNPKAYVIIGLMFSQFLARDGASLALIATVFTLNNLLAFVLWIAAGDRLAALFRTPRSARWLNAGFGLALAGVALWMLAG